jgi:lysophospholipase L1-like esterase
MTRLPTCGFSLKALLLLLVSLAGNSIVLGDDAPPVAPLKLEGKMVCVGASMTVGVLVKPGEGYVDLLRAKVQQEHLNLQVIGQGRSGWSTGAYVQNKKKIQEAMPADATIISILLGTNDSREEGTPAEVGKRAGENLDKLLDIYHDRAPDAQFIVALPPRQYPKKFIKRLLETHYGESSAANIIEIQAAFKAVARKRGILVIDLSELPSTPDKSIEGIHPNAAGHEEIFEAFWKGLTGKSPTTQP